MTTARRRCAFRLLPVWLLLVLIPAVLFGETQLPTAGEGAMPGRGVYRLLTQKEMDAVYAGGLSVNPAGLVIAVKGGNPGRIILWDEGPASAARHFLNTMTIRNEELQGR